MISPPLQLEVLGVGEVEVDVAATTLDEAVQAHDAVLGRELSIAAGDGLAERGFGVDDERAADGGIQIGLEEVTRPAVAMEEVHVDAVARPAGVAETLPAAGRRAEHLVADGADDARLPPPGCGCALPAHGKSVGEDKAKIYTEEERVVDSEFEQRLRDAAPVKPAGPLGIACRHCTRQPGQPCLWDGGERWECHAERIEDAAAMAAMTGGGHALTDQLIDGTGLV